MLLHEIHDKIKDRAKLSVPIENFYGEMRSCKSILPNCLPHCWAKIDKLLASL